MVRAFAFAVVAAALGLSREPGCSGVDDPQGGKNAPCTRDSDCKSGLECREGACADTSTPPTPTSTTTTTPTSTSTSPPFDSGAPTDSGAEADASDGGG